LRRNRHDACGHGLEEEPYFKYFSYKPFVTPYAGLVQIRRVAEETAQTALLEQFDTLNRLRGEVLEEIHRLLVEEFWYFQ